MRGGKNAQGSRDRRISRANRLDTINIFFFSFSLENKQMLSLRVQVSEREKQDKEEDYDAEKIIKLL
jgi:hypothetical protein